MQRRIDMVKIMLGREGEPARLTQSLNADYFDLDYVAVLRQAH
jgi:hypothetical protein